MATSLIHKDFIVKSDTFNAKTDSSGKVLIDSNPNHLILKVAVTTSTGSASWTTLTIGNNNTYVQAYNSSGTPVPANYSLAGTYYYVEM